jgi:murein DD-endopeptidase MepM/ murein hydrolase activator NlpD
MKNRTPRRMRSPGALGPIVAGAVLAALATVGVAATSRAGAPPLPPELPMLPAMHAAPLSVDTFFVGGYARGSFTEALATLASDLSPGERAMVGRHLDKIYLPVLEGGAMVRGGRLRVAYERTRRPDGSTRSIQVLAAEAAVGGGLHTVFLYDGGKAPGYYDDLGRSLDPVAWSGPLPTLRVTSPFKMNRMHPILQRVLPHTGVDFAAGFGAAVRATGDGSVSYAAVRGGYGNMVEIQHPNGYATRYAHLSGIAVRAGVPVRQGDVIGFVGKSGMATGPHLHYEVRRKGQPVDPLIAQAAAGSTEDVGYESGWRGERRKLGGLLARAPTMVNGRD